MVHFLKPFVVLVLAFLMLLPGFAPASADPTAPTGQTRSATFIPLDRTDRLHTDGPHEGALDLLSDLLTAQDRDADLAHLLVPLDVRQSPSGLHVRFTAAHEGVPIRGASAAVHYDLAGRAWLATLDLPEARPGSFDVPEPDSHSFVRAVRESAPAEGWAGASRTDGPLTVEEASPVWHRDGDRFDAAWRAVVRAPDAAGPEQAGWEVLVHPTFPARDEATPRWSAAEGTGRVFDPNPQVSARDPDLVDEPNGNETPTMTDLIRTVTLPRLDGPLLGRYHLRGEAVSIVPDVNTTDADFSYLRSDERFEYTMAYYHMDAAQAELRRLGFDDANNEPQDVIEHIHGMFNAYYSSDDHIAFGYHAPTTNGYADAAEDADVVVHEYGHAVQLDILPGFTGPERGAVVEGWADLFSLLLLLPANDGYDPACLGDWFGSYLDPDRTDGIPFCFRRADTGLTYVDVRDDCCHYAGQVLSGMAWNISLAAGRDVTLSLFTEANYLVPTSGADLRGFAEAVFHADNGLYGGAHLDLVAWSARTKMLDTQTIADHLGVEWVDHNPPRIDSVSPGVALPGELVYVRGHDLVGNSTERPIVRFGTHNVTAELYSNDWLMVSAPSLPVGTYSVSVLRGDGVALAYDGPFAITDPLVTDPIEPFPAAPGDTFDLTGSGFGAVPFDPDRTTNAYLEVEDAQTVIALETEVLDHGTRLRITIPADLAEGDYRELVLVRSDGKRLSFYGPIFGTFADLAVTVEATPSGDPADLLLPPAAGGRPEWVLRITNIGEANYTFLPDDPLAILVDLEAENGTGTWSRTRLLLHDLAPGDSVTFEVDLPPGCFCQGALPPSGMWHGTATLRVSTAQDPYRANDAVALAHDFGPHL